MARPRSRVHAKVLALFALTSLSLLFITLARMDQATGYELSIYRATPAPVWVLSVLILFVCVLAILLYLFVDEDWRFLTLVPIAIVVYLLVLLLPAWRGYYLPLSGDLVSHLGDVRAILGSGHVPDDNFYPPVHILGAILSLALDVAPRNIWSYLTGLSYLLYLTGPVLLASVIAGRRAAVLALLFAVPLLHSHFHRSINPSFFSFYFAPVLFYIYRKYKAAPADRTRLAVVAVPILGLVLFGHPVTAAVVALLTGIPIVLDLLESGDLAVVRSWSYGNVLRVASLLVMPVVAALWYFSFASFRYNLRPSSSSEASETPAAPGGEANRTETTEAGATPTASGSGTDRTASTSPTGSGSGGGEPSPGAGADPASATPTDAGSSPSGAEAGGELSTETPTVVPSGDGTVGGASPVERFLALLHQADVGIKHVVELAFFRYGQLFVYYALLVLVLAAVYRYDLYRRRAVRDVGLQLFAGVGIAALFLFNPLLVGSPLRVVRWSTLFLLVLFPLVILAAERRVERGASEMILTVLKVAAVVAVSVSLLVALSNVYAAPMTDKANSQVSHQHFEGSRWMVTHNDERIAMSFSHVKIRRIATYVDGPLHNRIVQPIPDQFGFEDDGRIASQYRRTESYILLSRLDTRFPKVYPPSVRSQTNQYPPGAIRQLNHAPEVDKIYHNGEYRVYCSCR